jgi:hypothetical protein
MTTCHIDKDFNADEIEEKNLVSQSTRSEQYQERMMTNFETQVYDYIVRHPGSTLEFIAEHFGHTHSVSCNCVSGDERIRHTGHCNRGDLREESMSRKPTLSIISVDGFTVPSPAQVMQPLESEL